MDTPISTPPPRPKKKKSKKKKNNVDPITLGPNPPSTSGQADTLPNTPNNEFTRGKVLQKGWEKNKRKARVTSAEDHSHAEHEEDHSQQLEAELVNAEPESGGASLNGWADSWADEVADEAQGLNNIPQSRTAHANVTNGLPRASALSTEHRQESPAPSKSSNRKSQRQPSAPMADVSGTGTPYPDLKRFEKVLSAFTTTTTRTSSPGRAGQCEDHGSAGQVPKTQNDAPAQLGTEGSPSSKQPSRVDGGAKVKIDLDLDVELPMKVKVRGQIMLTFM